MSKSMHDSDMGQEWETYVQNTARTFAYPPTPDLSRRISERLAAQTARSPKPRLRMALALLVVVMVLGALLAVPQVRAAVREVLRIGGITLFVEEPADTPAPLPPLLVPGEPVYELAGETTLKNAQKQVYFSIRIPEILGAPDHVYLQDFGGHVVVLVWVEPENPLRARLSLHLLAPGVQAFKGEPRIIQETSVNGQRAYWTQGPYILEFRRPYSQQTTHDLRRLVEGNVLIWEQDDITYRLESSLSLEEAVKIAESLQ